MAPLFMLAALAQGTPADWTGYPPPPAEAPLRLPPPTALLPDAGPRLLLAVGPLLGGGEAQLTLAGNGGPTIMPSLGLGLYFRIGEQLDDRWGFGPEFGGGTSVLWSFGRAAFTVSYTPVDAFTVAVGPSAWIDNTLITLCPIFAEGSGGLGGGAGFCPNTVAALGGELRLDWQFGVTRTTSGRRAFALGVVGDAGATVSDDANRGLAPGFSWSLYPTFGYAWY